MTSLFHVYESKILQVKDSSIFYQKQNLISKSKFLWILFYTIPKKNIKSDNDSIGNYLGLIFNGEFWAKSEKIKLVQ